MAATNFSQSGAELRIQDGSLETRPQVPIGTRMNAGVCFEREKDGTDIFLSNVNSIFDEKRKNKNVHLIKPSFKKILNKQRTSNIT